MIPILVKELKQNGSDDSLYFNLWVLVPINLFWGSCLFFTDNRWTAGFVNPFLKLVYKAFGFVVVGGCSNDMSTTTQIGDRLDEEFRNLVDDVPPLMLLEDELPKEFVDGEEEEEGEEGGGGGGEGKEEKTSIKSLKFADDELILGQEGETTAKKGQLEQQQHPHQQH